MADEATLQFLGGAGLEELRLRNWQTPIEPSQPFAVARDVSVVFRRAGHILGSATVDLRIGAKEGLNVVFSGNLGISSRSACAESPSSVSIFARTQNISSGDQLRITEDRAAPAVLRWLRGFTKAPRRTYVVHGEPGPAHSLAELVRAELGWDVRVAENGQTVPLPGCP